MNKKQARDFMEYLVTYINELGDCYDPLQILDEKEHFDHFVKVLSIPGTSLNETVTKKIATIRQLAADEMIKQLVS